MNRPILTMLGRKKILNRWMLFFHREVLWDYIPRTGWRYVEFGIVKIKFFPEEGCIYEKQHYKGVWIHFKYWLPFEINTP